MWLIFGIFWFINVWSFAFAFGNNVVITNAGVCLNGCSLHEKNFTWNQYRLKKSPDEPDYYTMSNKKLKPFTYSEDYVFSYCIGRNNDTIRCSPRENVTSTVFERFENAFMYEGYAVAVDLPCLNPCRLDEETGHSIITCLVDWDVFDGWYECSVRLDFDNFSKDFYQISTKGLILGRLDSTKKKGFVTLGEKNHRIDWRETDPAVSAGHKDLNNHTCYTECELIEDRLECTIASGSRSPCYINLRNVGTAQKSCRNWLNIKPEFEAERKKDYFFKYEQWNMRHLGKANYCKEGGVIVSENIIRLSELNVATDRFRCGTMETVPFITLLAKDKLILDDNVEIYGGVNRRFSQLTILAKKIQVTKQTVINISGSNADSGTGSWADGGNGGTLAAMALEWENTADLTVVASGGEGGCKILPKYIEKDEGFQIRDKEYRSIDISYRDFMFKFVGEESSYIGNPTCLEFESFGTLQYGNGSGGYPGRVLIYGSRQAPVLKIAGGANNMCFRQIPNSQNCMKVLYFDIARWYATPLNFPFSPFVFQEEYFYPVRKWISVLKEGWSDDEIYAMSKFVDEAQTKLGIDSPTMFYVELNYIISNSWNISNKLELKLSESLKKRSAGLNDAKNSSLLYWVYAATASHQRRVKGLDALITDFRLYIETKDADITALANAVSRNKMIADGSDKYLRDSDSKIKEANDLITRDVMPEIFDMRSKLEAELKLVAAQIQEMIHQAEEKILELNQNLNKAIASQALNTFLNSLKIVGGVVGMVGFPIAGSVIGGGSEITKTINNVMKPESKSTVPKLVPKEIWSNIKPCSDWINNKHLKLIAKLDDILSTHDGDVGLGDFLEFVRQKLQELKLATPTRDGKVTKRHQYQKTKEVDRLIRAEVDQLGGITKREAEKNKGPDAKTVAAGLKTTLDGANDLIKDFTKGLEDIGKIREELKEVYDIIMRLMQFDTDFHEKIMPMVLGLMETFNFITEELNGASLAAIDITSWNIENNINDVSEIMSKTLSIFNAKDDMLTTMNKIGKAVRMLATLFGRIVEAKEEKRLAHFQTVLASASATDIKIQEFQKNLNNTMLQSIIYCEVEKAIYAFRQWSFPFANVYLSDFNPLPYSIENINITEQLTIASATFSKIMDILKTDQYQLNDAHKFISSGDFINDEDNALDPFFTWDYATYNASILRLLAAKEPVYFYADVSTYMNAFKNYRKEAVKFRTIKFVFNVTNNKKKQSQIDVELNRCEMYAVHMGYSYFLFQNKTYLFSSPTSVLFKFGVGTRHQSTTKYAEGTPALSPFGMWAFRIMPKKPTYKLSGLEPNEHDVVNLELVGTGEYVSTLDAENFILDPEEVAKHYQEYEHNEPIELEQKFRDGAGGNHSSVAFEE